MDPLVYILPELHDMVFQHLNAPEFRNITEVTPYWNETLGKSLKMMEKVKIKLDLIYNTVEGTIRRYQNVCIESWLSHSSDYQKTMNYFLNLGHTTVDLEIRCLVVLSAENAKFFNEIELTKLKTLKLYFVMAELTTKLLGRCSLLTKLHLSGKTLKTISIPTNVNSKQKT